MNQQLQLPNKISKKKATSFTEFRTLFKDVKLYQSEIQSLFNLIDKQHMGRITDQDYEFFYENFIQPFQSQCDKDKDYILDDKEIVECLKSPKLSGIPEEYQDQSKFNMTQILNKDRLNFNDYVFLRRASLAWNQCSYENNLSKLQMICALNVIVPMRSLSMGEAEQIFKLANIFQHAKITNVQQIPTIDFITFLSLANIFNVFDQFDTPIKDGSINKYDILKQINYQTMPIFMTYETVQQIYMSFDEDLRLDLPIHLSIIDYEKRMQKLTSKDDTKIDFLQFATYFTLHKYFRNNGKENQGYITSKEFQDMFKNEQYIPKIIKDSIDALEFTDVDITKPQEKDEESKESSTSQDQKAQILESDQQFFLRSFLQKNQQINLKTNIKLNSNNNQQKSLDKQQKQTSLFNNLFQFTQKKKQKLRKTNFNKGGGDNSEKIFNMFDSNNKGQMQFLDFIRFFKYTWLFLNYDVDDGGFLNQNKIEAGQFAFISPIPISIPESQEILKVQDSSSLFKFVDLKLFYSLFLRNFCFYDDSLNAVENQKQIHKESVIRGLTKLGLQLFEEQASDSLSGTDDLNIELYDKDKVYQNAVENEQKAINIKMQKAQEEKK